MPFGHNDNKSKVKYTCNAGNDVHKLIHTCINTHLLAKRYTLEVRKYVADRWREERIIYLGFAKGKAEV